MWRYLRAGRLGGFRFERNFSVEGRVFPFFCRAAKLAIAIDRETLGGALQRDYKFDTYLLARGVMVEHFAQEQIRSATDRVAEQILASCRSRTIAPAIAANNLSAQKSPLDSNARFAANRRTRRAWIAGIAVTAVLAGLIFLVGVVSCSTQPTATPPKPLATLTPAPTHTPPGPSPTLVELKLPTPSAERQSAFASASIFARAEKNLDSQPQSVVDLLLPQLSQFTTKSDLEDAYSYLGRAELKLLHYHAAASYLKQLYTLEPSPEYLYSLAVAYDLDGDWQNALMSYRVLAESSGNDAVVFRASAQQRIKELEQRLQTPAP